MEFETAQDLDHRVQTAIMKGVETSFDQVQQQRIWRRTDPVSGPSPNTISSRIADKIWKSVLPDEESPFSDIEPTNPNPTDLEASLPFPRAQTTKIRRKLAGLNNSGILEEQGMDSDCSDLSEIMSNFSLEDLEDHRQPPSQTVASSNTIQSHRGLRKHQDFCPLHTRPETSVDTRRNSHIQTHLDRKHRIMKSSSGKKPSFNDREYLSSQESFQRSRHPHRKERVAHPVHYGSDHYRCHHRPHYRNPRSDYWRPDADRKHSSNSPQARGRSRTQSTSFQLQHERHSKEYPSTLDYGPSMDTKTQRNQYRRPVRRDSQPQTRRNIKTPHVHDSSVTQSDVVVDHMEICEEESSLPRTEQGRKIVLPMRPRF